MNFRVGQKVVCVDDGPNPWPNSVVQVRKGEIYTIREIEPACPHWSDPSYGVRLIEIIEKPKRTCCGFIEPAYNASRFRPVVERKTDISIFTKMLDDAGRKLVDAVC